MDPSTLIPPSKYGDIWRFISSNTRWASLILWKRKWLILLAGLAACGYTRIVIPKGFKTYEYLTFQVISDSTKAFPLEEKSRYTKYLTDLYYASDTIYRHPMTLSMYSTDYTIVVKLSTSNGRADSLIQHEIALLHDIAKANLPAGLHLQKISEHKQTNSSRPLILTIAFLAGMTTAVMVVLILGSFASPWLKLKKAGLPFVGYLKNYGRNRLSDRELLFVIQDLLPANALSGRHSILFTGSAPALFVSSLHALMPKSWKTIRLELTSDCDETIKGLYDYVTNDIPFKQILQHDPKGLPYISLNCPDNVASYFMLRSESKMAAFFDELKEYAIMLITCDPLDRYPHSLALLPYASKVVVTHHAEYEAQTFYKVVRVLKDNHAPGLCYLIHNVPTEHYVTEKFWL